MGRICKVCHQIGRGCCVLKSTDIIYQIGIFYGEIQLIKEKMNMEEWEFIVRDTVANDYRESLSTSIHPLFDKIYYKNTRFRLKTIDEKCVFLTDEGCNLPEDIRPLYCRIYPFFPSDKGDQYINVLSSHECTAQYKSTHSWAIVNEHFQYNKEYLYDLFKQFKDAADEHVAALTYKK